MSTATIGRPTSSPSPGHFKEIMAKARINPYGLSKALKVSYSTVRHWMEGACPNPKYIEQLISIFGIQAMRPYLRPIDTTGPSWERYRNFVSLGYADYFTAPKTLRMARQVADLNMAACADIFHVTRKTWSDWEIGRTAPSYANRILLEDAFGPLFYKARPGIYQSNCEVIPDDLYYDDEPLTFDEY